MSDEFMTTTFIDGQTVTVRELATNRVKAEEIIKSATVARFEHGKYPYAVVEVSVLVDLIETWLNYVEGSVKDATANEQA